MRSEYLSWTEVAALCHGCFSIGLTAFVSARYLFSKVRIPMLLISIGFVLVTRAIGIWGDPKQPWFWVAIIGWVFSDFGLFLYLVLGPPVKSRNGRTT
jgi:hypothetical protein